MAMMVVMVVTTVVMMMMMMMIRAAINQAENGPTIFRIFLQLPIFGNVFLV